MNPDFWKGRRVLITGHSGFKGAWLSLWLSDAGAEVTGYALAPPTMPSLFEDAGIAGRVRSIMGDIRDLPLLLEVFSETRPEVVIHMAAQSLVRASYDTPVETYAVNVLGTVHILEAARQTPGVRAVVAVTSDKCYENREWCWGYREGEPMGGADPYSSSKGCAELATAAYRRSFFTPGPPWVASVRAGNVIGGGDWAADRLVPDIARAFLSGLPVPIRNPRAIRPWQHVLEPLSGYLAVAEELFADSADCARAFNFGPDEKDAVSVGELADRMAALWEGASWENRQEPGAPHEAHYLKLDSSLARDRLSWFRRLNLTDALAWTCDWYRARDRGEDMGAYSLSQIREYQSLPERR
ncbi:MAG: CDP-glucose 4,6-dehydratase [Proteobacteria bacterium]|nr:CDP-glucose 4,6-dehydratase [Pseudomonadota bacterium]